MDVKERELKPSVDYLSPSSQISPHGSLHIPYNIWENMIKHQDIFINKFHFHYSFLIISFMFMICMFDQIVIL